MFDRKLVLRLLRDWALYSERHWYQIDDVLGCYGTGYNSWGVQTNQKYVTALTALANCSELDALELGIDRDWAHKRALSALRFSLRSHKSADGECTDGQKWGGTWISALGLERMMAALHLLRPHFTLEDENIFRRLMESEADYLLNDYSHGSEKEISANVWGSSGKNHPESNGWNGALLWRTAELFPQHPHNTAWRERSHRFLMNAVSVASDANESKVIAGRPVKEWHIGANFFPHYALDHHAYFNVGYMVICISGAAMLHFDMKVQKLMAPESLHWHQADLWQVLRRFIFSNGRLARLGGDTRVRYAYCQEYLLPSLLYAADQLGEKHAAELIEQQLELIVDEAKSNGDGSFYSRRLEIMAATDPYYYTRLESDRSCALAMLLLYAPVMKAPVAEPRDSFEKSVAGGWIEPEYGAVSHRSETRLASFSWRAIGMTQGLCLPPSEGHLAEWQGNLSGDVRFLADDSSKRRLRSHHIEQFDGGFLTYGSIDEGINLTISEAWQGSEMGRSQLAFAALPDGHTVIGLQYCRTAKIRTFTRSVKGLRWCLPNDTYNDFQRQFTTQQGKISLTSPPSQAEVWPMGSNWANVDEKMGVVNLFGASQLCVHRVPERRAGKLKSLFVEEICSTCDLQTKSQRPDTLVLDCGWALLSSVDSAQTSNFAAKNNQSQLKLIGELRGLKVTGIDEREYLLIANFGAAAVSLKWPYEKARLLGEKKEATVEPDSKITLGAGEVGLYGLID